MRCPPTPAAPPEGRFGGFGYSVRHDGKHGAARLARARKGGLGFAVCNQTGSEYYGELMLPNALMVLANGIAMDRDMVVSALSESPPWRTYDIGDVRLIEVDNGNAVSPARHTARPTSQPSLVRCRV